MQTGSRLAGLTTLKDLVEQFRVTADAAAIMTLDQTGAVVTYTYSQIADDISRLGGELVRSGCSDGAMILLWAPNSVEWVIAYFAITVSGNVVIPLDDQTSAEGLDAVLRHSRPARIVTTASHLPTLEAAGVDVGAACVLLDQDRPDSASRKSIGRDDAADQLPSSAPEQVASLLYTSGTTGQPKAVPLTHANLMSNVRAIMAANLVSAADRVLVPLPLHHVYPATVGMLSPLACGSAIVIPRGLSGPELTSAASATGATVLVGVPRLYSAVVESIEAGVRSGGVVIRKLYPLLLRLSIVLKRRFGLRVGRVLFGRIHEGVGADLRILASGGARLEPELAWTLEGLGWEVLTGYGLTETSPVVTFNTTERKRLATQGAVLPGVEVDIDKTPGEPHGEILVRGPNVFSGYWKNDAATRAAFTANGWFRTGDLGFLDADGFLHIVGRSKEIIVLADGKNVVPEDTERQYESSPLIREVAVLERNGQLVALVVPDDEALRQRGALRMNALLREEIEKAMLRMPSYLRIADYRLTRRSLPRTRLGKLKRHLLPPMFEEAVAARAAPRAEELSDADRQLLRSAAAGKAWQWLQARFADTGMSLDSSPQLDLGIDSLTWVTITNEVKQEFGIELPGEAMSRVLTIRDLLQAIDTASRDAGETARAAPEPDGGERYLEDRSLPLRVFGELLLGLDWLLMRGCFRLRVRGLDRLPGTGPFVIAPNHASYLDPLAIAAALPYRLRANTCWAGWAPRLHKRPFFRAVSRATRIIPVDPDLDPGGSILLGAKALESGRVLVWFPEGVRSPDGALQAFQHGIGVLLDESRVPVVPTAIHGSYEAWPLTRNWPRLRRIEIEFGAPQATDSLLADGQGDDAAAKISDGVERRVRDLINSRLSSRIG